MHKNRFIEDCVSNTNILRKCCFGYPNRVLNKLFAMFNELSYGERTEIEIIYDCMRGICSDFPVEIENEDFPQEPKPEDNFSSVS